MGYFDTFRNPPREYTMIPFWFLNDDLTDEELKRQIDDFESHGVYGFIPHARMGLSRDIGFMSEAWLRFTRVCVEYAAGKGMFVVLYDEGMYPSGSCAGQVVAANPRHAARCVERRAKGEIAEGEELIWEDGARGSGVPAASRDGDVASTDEKWAYVHCRSMGTIRGAHYGEDDGEPGAPPAGDLLSAEAMASFRHLVLDGHYDALKEHFGKTIIGVFTDEPSILGRGGKKNVKPWTWGFADYLQNSLGYDFRPHLAALWDDGYPDAERLRRDYYRAVGKRLEETYYAPYSKWCEDHGVALTGHPAGPDDIGLLKYFQIPGQDIVWRYIEPYKDKSIEGEQSTMGKCSASAQRHYGRKRNMNECFGAYGWEFTYDEMLYVTNWLFARGVNMIMPHAFYYSLRDKRRDERPPDVGPHSPWWKDYKKYADYVRRVSWLLSQGRQVCSFAILGTPSALPWRAARAMFETQHDFNYLDTDALTTQCAITAEAITIRDMTYRALIIDGAEFTDREAIEILKPLNDAGRVIAYRDPVAGVSKVAADEAELVRLLDVIAFPDVTINPPNPNLRYIHLKNDEADVYFFANEGKDDIDVKLYVAATPPRQWLDPQTGEVLGGSELDHLVLPPLTSRVLTCS